ncbi:MAG: amidase domain-containing protein [Oscillospiraceae bacterium]|nr:amidase domain-containing protein [Oscillospiraceae bacterium]
MSKHRNRRRFYPEFYTDEELKIMNQREKCEIIQKEEIKEAEEELREEEKEAAQEYYIRSAAGMIYEPSEPIKEPEAAVATDITETAETLEAFELPEPPELIEEIIAIESRKEEEEDIRAMEEASKRTENGGYFVRPVYSAEQEESSGFDYDYAGYYGEEEEEEIEIEETKYIEERELELELETEPEEIKIEIPVHMHIEDWHDTVPVFAPVHSDKEEIREHEEIQEQIQEHKQEEIIANEPPVLSEHSGINPFDREKAVEYARRWSLDRNPDYYNFEEIGGDCTNYVSQILLAGGCKMDRNSPVYGWYYNTANDKSPSWTGVEHLYNYLVREKTHGVIASEIDLNEVEAGDIVQLSFNGKNFQHTPFIISVRREPSGEVSYGGIKICAHSFDSDNRALDTYQWRQIRFIRILGYK